MKAIGYAATLPCPACGHVLGFDVGPPQFKQMTTEDDLAANVVRYAMDVEWKPTLATSEHLDSHRQ